VLLLLLPVVGSFASPGYLSRVRERLLIEGVSPEWSTADESVNRYLFFDVPIWVLGFLALLLMLGCSEVGFRVGYKSRDRFDESMRSRTTIFESAILGVLGLLMGFTMSMAVTRFEARRQLVIDEANAIGTTWLRSKIIPAPGDAEFAALLRQYVDARVAYTARTRLDELPEIRAQDARLQRELWSRAMGFAVKDRSVNAGLLLQSLNQSIDLEAARWAFFWGHVPQSVIYLNALIAMLAAALLGYGFGMIGKRHVVSIVLLAASISGVLSVIVDLDRPWQGFIKVSQEPMFDLQKQMANSP
jgi:hypothetical protein